jgi:protein-tyrosine-phosphatase
MKQTVLFACPHSAAKSVLAATYFQRRAQQHGLDVDVRFGGIEPDAEIAPAVKALLHAEGFDIVSQRPRLLWQVDIDQADYVVSLGCPLDQFDLSETFVAHWDDVQAPSKNLQAARDAIIGHVNELVAQLRQETL